MTTVPARGDSGFWLKGCPRCGEDLYESADHYGRYVVCIQCGYYLTEGEEVALRYTSQGQIAVTSGEEAGRPLKRGGERALMGTVAGPPPILGTPEAIEYESA